MPDKGMGRLGILRRKNQCPTAPVLEGERPVHDTQGVGPQLPIPGHPETDEPRCGVFWALVS